MNGQGPGGASRDAVRLAPRGDDGSSIVVDPRLPPLLLANVHAQRRETIQVKKYEKISVQNPALLNPQVPSSPSFTW